MRLDTPFICNNFDGPHRCSDPCAALNDATEASEADFDAYWAEHEQTAT